MAFGLGRWRPRHLLVSWGIYWALLASVTIGPGLLALWRLTRPGKHGSASASFDDGVLGATVAANGVTAWTGATGLGTLALYVAGPPLLLWLAWLVSRPRRDGLAEGLSAGSRWDAGEGSGLAGGRERAAGALKEPAAEPLATARPGRPVEQERRGRAV